MRLVNTTTLELEDFYDIHVPEYAILSHTWADGEVSLQDWADRNNRRFKPGFKKITSACAEAVKDGLGYLWADTNCIDKTSSAELSEAINSMFKWYQRSNACYAHLDDVDHATIAECIKVDSPFRKAKWFTRGWTLQELIAPTTVRFFSHDWQEIGAKANMQLALAISDITGITPWCLRRGMFSKLTPLRGYSVAQRLSWASGRFTTRVEDQAYSLLGVFDITMPLVYGEGSEAFTRLLEEIVRKYTDHSIFASQLPYVDFLPRSPREFGHSQSVAIGKSMHLNKLFTPVSHSYPFQMTNSGLQMKLPIVETMSPAFVFAVLDCWDADSGTTETTRCLSRIWIPLLRKKPQRTKEFTRLLWPHTFLPVRLVPGHEFGLEDGDASAKDGNTGNTNGASGASFVDLVPPDSCDDIVIQKPYATTLFVPKWQPRDAASPFLLCFPRGTANYRLYGIYPDSPESNSQFRDQVASGLPLIQSRDLGSIFLSAVRKGGRESSSVKLYGAMVIFKRHRSSPPQLVAIHVANIIKTAATGEAVYEPRCKVFGAHPSLHSALAGNQQLTVDMFEETSMENELVVTVQKAICRTPATAKGQEHRSVGLVQVVFDRTELLRDRSQSLNAVHVAPGGLLDYMDRQSSDAE